MALCQARIVKCKCRFFLKDILVRQQNKKNQKLTVFFKKKLSLKSYSPRYSFWFHKCSPHINTSYFLHMWQFPTSLLAGGNANVLLLLGNYSWLILVIIKTHSFLVSDESHNEIQLIGELGFFMSDRVLQFWNFNFPRTHFIPQWVKSYLLFVCFNWESQYFPFGITWDFFN